MAKRKTGKIKGSGAAGKVWRLRDLPRVEIAKAVDYPTASVNIYLNNRFMEEADKLWSLSIREPAKNRCAICGDSPCDAHHILEKSTWLRWRYDKRNGVCICQDHHRYNRDICPHFTGTAVFNWWEWLRVYRENQYDWWKDAQYDKRPPVESYEEAYRRLAG